MPVIPQPYYWTGPATRPGAMRKWAKNQDEVEALRNRRAAAQKGKAPVKKTKPKVVASPGTGPATNYNTTVKPNNPTPKGKGTNVNSKVVLTNKKNQTKPSASSKGKPNNAGKGKGKQPQSAVPNLQDIPVGIDPTAMANAMTNAGYDASINAINNSIRQNRADMAAALSDLSAWANQISTEQARGAGESAAAWNQAVQGAAGSDANINQLFGGAAAGEAAAFAGAGEDMLRGLSASDQAFNARMAPILTAQSGDYQRRTRSDFNKELKGLQTNLLSAQAEKGNAFKQNYLAALQAKWDRQQQLQQGALAKAAYDQSAKLAGLEQVQQRQAVQSNKAAIEGQTLENQQKRIQIRASKVALQQAQQKTNGFDWSDPHTGATVGQAALSGMLNKQNVFAIKPSLAWQNAQIALQQAGLIADPRAVQAAWLSFQAALNNSHGHGKWRAYYINKNGQLVYDPSRVKKKR